MGDLVTFPVEVPDGTYTGKWFRYDITIELGGEEVVGKCVAGTTKEYFDFCVVRVVNGQATVKQAT